MLSWYYIKINKTPANSSIKSIWWPFLFLSVTLCKVSLSLSLSLSIYLSIYLYQSIYLSILLFVWRYLPNSSSTSKMWQKVNFFSRVQLDWFLLDWLHKEKRSQFALLIYSYLLISNISLNEHTVGSTEQKKKQ